MTYAFVGDIHGKINEMYEAVSVAENVNSESLDGIFQVGDFHAIRDEKDLNQFPIKEKYRKLGDFPSIYQKGSVPRQTYFIGGNHENVAWLKDYPEGSALVENLDYLGRSGVKRFNGLHVGWVSGTYSEVDYEREKPKKDFHFTRQDVEKVLKSDLKPDVLIFHDWPHVRSLAHYVESASITDSDLFEKSAIRDIGSEPLFALIRETSPRYVFSGHNHFGLQFDVDIDGNTTTFTGLNNLNSHSEFNIYTVDSKQLDLRNCSLQKGSLLDSVSYNDRKRITTYLTEMQEGDSEEGIRGLLYARGELESDSSFLVDYAFGIGYYRRFFESDNQHDLLLAEQNLRRSINTLEFADSHMFLGYVLKTKGQNEEAKGEFETAMRINPGFTHEAEQQIASL